MERRLKENQIEVVDWKLFANEQCQSLIKASQEKQANIQQEIDRLNIRAHTSTLKFREGEKTLQEVHLFFRTVLLHHLCDGEEINLMFLFLWQINENVEMEIEYLLQKFDDEIQEHQVQTFETIFLFHVSELYLRNIM